MIGRRFFPRPVQGPARRAYGEAACVLLAIVLTAASARAQRPTRAFALRGPVDTVDRSTQPALTTVVHGSHQAVSKALIDPIFTHHAILEDELRMNFFRRSASAAEARGVATVEVAYAFTDALGAEVFIPYVLAQPDSLQLGRVLDIEAQPLKWSFLRRRDLIMTAVAGVVVPVGSEGPGTERVWRFEPHFFVDAALGPVALQTNVIASFGDNGDRELEVRTSFARMTFLNAHASIGPLIESLWDIPLTGGERAEPLLAPGLKLQLGGWHFGAGYLFPLRSRSGVPSELALTAGYHVSFSRRPPPSAETDPSLPEWFQGAP